jgi:signal transduction histidine kinase
MIWLTIATALFLGFAALPWFSSFGPHSSNAVAGMVAVLLVTASSAGLMFAASRRRGLPSRLRRALTLLAASVLLVALGNLLRLLSTLGAVFPVVPGIGVVSTLVIWGLGFAGLIRLPLAPVARGDRWRVATDVAIAVVGMGLAIFVVSTLPGMQRAPAAARIAILADGLMETVNVIALNLILVRGAQRAIRRAVWCLAGTLVIETVYLVALQYALGRGTHDFRLVNSLFFVDYTGYLYAGVFFLNDWHPQPDAPLVPDTVRVFNPLPVLAVCGVGTLLILSALRRPDPAELPLAVGIVLMSLLLLVRVLGATWENLRLLREEAAIERRRHTEKMEAVGRLAAGVSHVINNLMTIVLGNAELELERVDVDIRTRYNLASIGLAAERASALAARLRAASWRPTTRHEPRRLAELVGARRQAVNRILGKNHDIVWELEESASDVMVDESEIEVVLDELVANAREAMPDGGQVTIRVREKSLSVPPPSTMFLSVPPGFYAVLEVTDSGRGIQPDDVSQIFEPFFTTRPLHEGRGLGLSVVHGIVAGLGGGLSVESAPGAGTRICIYLPLATRAAGA